MSAAISRFAITIGLVLSALTSTMQAQEKIIGDANRKPRSLDCSNIFSAGCQSFNELLQAQDKDIVNAVAGTGKAARVCFIEGEDNFVVLDFDLPLKSLWRKNKDGIGFHNGPRIARFKRYRDGVSDDFFLVRLTWNRYDDNEETSPTADGKSLLGEDVTLSIDENETNFNAKWQNKANTTTTYGLSIRLATGRFKETYDWKDTKGQHHESSNVGHCVRYDGGVPE